ncbi:MAG: hypothetical protein EOO61_19800, partial [Hymenobacter sp.]
MKTLYLLLLPATLLATACSSPTSKTPAAQETGHQAVVVRPAPLAPAIVPGYHFPEDSTTIEGWVQHHDSLAIYRH